MRLGSAINPQELSIGQKLLQVNWMLILIVIATGLIGIAMLYSAANGSWHPWASVQAIRFSALCFVLLMVALIDLRFWMRYAYVIYFIGLALLVAVEVMGATGMGARRWINLGVILLQPSEVMKICLVLASRPVFPRRDARGTSAGPLVLIVPLLMVIAPVILGPSASRISEPRSCWCCARARSFSSSGVRMWKFGLVIGGVLAAIPIAWGKPARIPAEADPDLSQPRERSARRGLSHTPGQDRHGFGRRVR